MDNKGKGMFSVKEKKHDWYLYDIGNKWIYKSMKGKKMFVVERNLTSALAMPKGKKHMK